MADTNRYDVLNEAIDAIVARRSVPAPQPELATLLVIAADLRDLPRSAFKSRLRSELFQEDRMETASAVSSIRQYLFVDGADKLIEFLEKTFDARVLVRVPKPDGKVMHAELKIGDSVMELGDSGEVWMPMAQAVHVYIENADAVYRRAIAAGAKSLSAPVNQPYGDREAGFVDPTGNQWFVATYLEGGPRRPGYGTLTPSARVAGAARLIDFVKRVFDGDEVSRDGSPSGEIYHAEVRVGGSMLEISDARGQWGPIKCAFHIHVDDCDATYDRALRAGATAVMKPEDKPYGERQATVTDEFGNYWFIAS
jgi:uncharacterized glyoxalase superfamily protein PhnB